MEHVLAASYLTPAQQSLKLAEVQIVNLETHSGDQQLLKELESTEGCVGEVVSTLVPCALINARLTIHCRHRHCRLVHSVHPTQVELGKLVLKRFLLLVLLLDRAMLSGTLPAGTPLLFRLNSPAKTSSEVSLNCTN
jgi:hypothetical protein